MRDADEICSNFELERPRGEQTVNNRGHEAPR
jgi:hypothetical protein